MLNIKMSIKGGAVFIFILPGGPLPSVSYATGHDACVWSRRNDDGQARNQRGVTGQLPPLKFSKTYLVVRYKIKLQSFYPSWKHLLVATAMTQLTGVELNSLEQ